MLDGFAIVCIGIAFYFFVVSRDFEYEEDTFKTILGKRFFFLISISSVTLCARYTKSWNDYLLIPSQEATTLSNIITAVFFIIFFVTIFEMSYRLFEKKVVDAV